MSDESMVSPELEEKIAELSILQQSLEESKSKAAEYYDQLLRLKAEFENFRKRTEKEKAEARLWGKQEVLMPLVGIVDVFEQALSQAQHTKEVKSIVQGLGFLHKNFSQLLKEQEVESMDLVGKDFDPHVAEVMEQKEADDESVGKVLAEIQKGYTFKGHVLRPARVSVGVAKAEVVPEEEA